MAAAGRPRGMPRRWQRGARPATAPRQEAGSCHRFPYVEHAHPPELDELGLMRVTHVEPGLVTLKGELEDAALALALHDGVDRAQGRGERRAVIVVVEEVAVQMEGVDRVELGHVDEIHPHRPRAV